MSSHNWILSLALASGSMLAQTGSSTVIGTLTDPADSLIPSATLTLTEDQFDARLVPWLYWSYNGHVVIDSKQPLVPPNLNVTVLDALTRPSPTLTNGTPTRLSFDPATATLNFEFSTRRPDGHRALRRLETVVTVPKRRYPTGYTVTVVGADVTSRPCAPTLTLRNKPGADTVSVRVAPSSCP